MLITSLFRCNSRRWTSALGRDRPLRGAGRIGHPGAGRRL